MEKITFNLKYAEALNDFMSILVLGGILMIIATSATEILKNMFKYLLTPRCSWMMILASGVVSIALALFWANTFAADEINFDYALWLGLCLWLGSQGLYVKLEESDGFLGRHFRSLSVLLAELPNQLQPESDCAEELFSAKAQIEELTNRLLLCDEPLPEPEPEPEPDTPPQFIFPLSYIAVSAPFSPPEHYGVDFGWSSSYGGSTPPVYAAFSGTVDMSGYYSGGAGNMVRVYADIAELNSRFYAYFKHLSEVAVKIGQNVEIGDRLGIMGASGDASGNHLHFDLIRVPIGASYSQSNAERARSSVNPLLFLCAEATQRVGAETDRRYQIRRCGSKQ